MEIQDKTIINKQEVVYGKTSNAEISTKNG